RATRVAAQHQLPVRIEAPDEQRPGRHQLSDGVLGVANPAPKLTNREILRFGRERRTCYGTASLRSRPAARITAGSPVVSVDEDREQSGQRLPLSFCICSTKIPANLVRGARRVWWRGDYATCYWSSPHRRGARAAAS